MLIGALGGLGAWAASAVGRASPARAEGETIVVGGEYTTATSVTKLTNQTTGANVIEAVSTSAGAGVKGTSATSIGVWGASTEWTGVTGESVEAAGVAGVSTDGVGVRGFSANAQGVIGIGSIGVEGTSDSQFGWGVGGSNSVSGGIGVWGQANGAGSRGVWGNSNAGQAVRGQATSGTGVFGSATSGYAIQGSGRVRFGKVSGVATIQAGSTSRTVNPGVNVTTGSFVLLTPMANIGSRALWFTKNVTTNRITIRMSSSRSSATKVAWLLLG
jgi:hypothetical protein